MMNRRDFLTGTSALALSLAALPAIAQPAPSNVLLFRLVSAKDELIFGLPKAQIDALGGAAPVEAVAKEIARAGQLPVWSYAPRRDAQGAGRMMPIQRIVVFAAGVIRIEPYTSDMPVVAPTP